MQEHSSFFLKVGGQMKTRKRRRKRYRLKLRFYIIVTLTLLLLIALGYGIFSRLRPDPEPDVSSLSAAEVRQFNLEFRHPHHGRLYERDLEALKAFIRNGFEFTRSYVLFDADVTLDLRSRYAILVNLTTGEVIYERNADARAYPASLTKMMTVLVGLENATADILPVHADFVELFLANASIAGFTNGEYVTLNDVLYAVMLPSGADATSTLAYHVAGSYEGFVQLMNQRAKELGLDNTNFANASGLHHDDHYTTARDMAVLVRLALLNPEFRAIFSARSYLTEMGTQLLFTSRMFDRLESPFFDGGEILGGKTGFTLEALLCLASFATDGVYEYALITMYAEGGPFTLQYHVLDAVDAYQYFLGNNN